MRTTTTTIGSAQAPDFASLSDQEREIATAWSRYLPSFHRQAFRYLGNAADAEDAVQDALLSAYKHMGQFRAEARISTWLSAIVINSARMHLRRRRNRIHVSLDEHPDPGSYPLAELLPDHRPGPEEQYLKSDLANRILQLTRHLSPVLRHTIQLRHLDGLTIRQMAGVLGVAEGTVKARIARARAKLRLLLRKNKPRVAQHPSIGSVSA